MLGLVIDAAPDADGRTLPAYPRVARVEVEAKVGLARRLARFTMLLTQAAPDAEPVMDAIVCGRCGRHMPVPDGWYTLQMEGSHLPTVVCAPCHAVATVTVH